MFTHSRFSLLPALVLVVVCGCSDNGGPDDGDDGANDQTPPALSSVSALDESHVLVTFSEPVRKASAENLAAYLIVEVLAPYAPAVESPGDTLLVLAASITSVPETVALTTEPMDDIPYRLSVTGVTDLAGNSILSTLTHGFTGTITPDVTPPQLVYRSPGPGATGVAIAMPVGLQFSEPVYLYGLSWYSGVTPVLFNITTADNMRYEVHQDQPLTPATTYTVELTGVQDFAGNFMNNVTWSFTTAGGGDVTPPTFVSSSPAHGQTNVNVNADLSITFSEAIDQTDFEIEVVPDVGDGDIVFTGGGRTLVFDPDYPLLASQQYDVTILPGGVKDLAGNGIVDPVYITFTTASPPGSAR